MVLAIAIPVQGGAAAAVLACSHHQKAPAIQAKEAKQAKQYVQGHLARKSQDVQSTDRSSQALAQTKSSDKAQLHADCKRAKACCQPLAAFSPVSRIDYSPQVVEATSVPRPALSWAEPVPHKPPKA